MKIVQSHILQLIVLIALSLLLIRGSVTADENLFFICNESIHENELSKADIINIFLGKKTVWGDQRPITICLFRERLVYRTFTIRYLKRTPLQYERFWRSMLFTGKGIFPKTFSNKEKLLEFIAETNGAIGYSSSEVNTKGVKTISIIN